MARRSGPGRMTAAGARTGMERSTLPAASQLQGRTDAPLGVYRWTRRISRRQAVTDEVSGSGAPGTERGKLMRYFGGGIGTRVGGRGGFGRGRRAGTTGGGQFVASGPLLSRHRYGAHSGIGAVLGPTYWRTCFQPATRGPNTSSPSFAGPWWPWCRAFGGTGNRNRRAVGARK